MVMQVRRTLSVGATPAGLAEGQLSVGMGDGGDSPTLWVGVPTAIDPSGIRQIRPDAPDDGVTYARRNGGWSRTASTTVSASTAPPAAPQVGDFWYQPDTLFLLLWNGTAWVSTAYKIPGVTNGAEAAAGEVGQFVSNNRVSANVGPGFTGANANRFLTLNLTPGDWNAWAMYYAINMSSDAYGFWGVLCRNSLALNQTQNIVLGPAGCQGGIQTVNGLDFVYSGTLGPIRVNLSAADGVDFRILWDATFGQMQWTVALMARRAR